MTAWLEMAHNKNIYIKEQYLAWFIISSQTVHRHYCLLGKQSKLTLIEAVVVVVLLWNDATTEGQL